MLEVCEQVATDFDLKVNCTKSVAMRIGRCFNVECTPLKLAGVAVKYVTNVEYLGVCLVAGTHFKCSVDHLKVKFCRVFNYIFFQKQNCIMLNHYS